MEEIKISKVDVKNLKAVSKFTAFFNGKSAHVTGLNGIGKSTVIRCLTDRLRGLKPSIITKIGEKEGKTIMELTDGCRFEWEYNEQGKDALNYFMPEQLRPVKRDVFKHICSLYFPNQFDINKFLTTTEPRKRLQMISELVDVDLTKIQIRYKEAFDIRKEAKRDLKTLEAQIKPEPEKLDFEGLDCEAEQKNVDDLQVEIKSKKLEIESERKSLNDQYSKNKASNDVKERNNKETYLKNLDEWLGTEEVIESEINNFNSKQKDLKAAIEQHKQLLDEFFNQYEGSFLIDCFDLAQANDIITNMEQPKILKTYISTPKPELTELDLIDPMPESSELDNRKIELSLLERNLLESNDLLNEKKDELSDLSSSKKVYDLQLNQWQVYKKAVQTNKDYVQECENKVAKILEKIKEIISATKLPSEFSIDLTDKNDILFKPNTGIEYFPITNETLADSAIYIAAFKLQINYLEVFRVAHFDVSYLDYRNRKIVLKEAINMNIQLISESASLDKKKDMLQYKITEE